MIVSWHLDHTVDKNTVKLEMYLQRVSILIYNSKISIFSLYLNYNTELWEGGSTRSDQKHIKSVLIWKPLHEATEKISQSQAVSDKSARGGGMRANWLHPLPLATSLQILAHVQILEFEPEP